MFLLLMPSQMNPLLELPLTNPACEPLAVLCVLLMFRQRGWIGKAKVTHLGAERGLYGSLMSDYIADILCEFVCNR